MAEVFAGSAQIPSELMRWPTNPIDALLISHLSVTLSFQYGSKSGVVFFLIPANIQDIINEVDYILLWNTSGALHIPNGSLLKQYLPNGVMKVVNGRDSSARGICQNPELASSLLNTLAPVSVSSTLGIGYVFLMMLLLSGFKSTQILTFSTTTTPAKHLGQSTQSMVNSIITLLEMYLYHCEKR